MSEPEQRNSSSERITVAQIVPELESGGVERGTVDVARELVRRGHRSIVISNGGRLVDQLEGEGSEHIQWPVQHKSLATFRFAVPLARMLRDQGVDILHARSRVPAWVSVAALKLMPSACRPRFVTTCHGLYSVNFYSAVMTRGERVIAISHTVADYIRQNYRGVDDNRIVTVYRGVDTQQYYPEFRPTTTWLQNWHEQFPQCRGRILITLTGRISRLKGHDVFVELMRRLQTRLPNAVGLIVGAEDVRRPGFAAEIRRQVEELGLTNVVFTGHRTDVREIFSVSDVVLSVSKKEGFGRTAAEALSLGTPVVGFDQSGVGEILQHMFPEGRVTHGDIDGLTATTCRVIGAQPEVPRNTLFTLCGMLDQVTGLYEDLVAQTANMGPSVRSAA